MIKEKTQKQIPPTFSMLSSKDKIQIFNTTGMSPATLKPLSKSGKRKSLEKLVFLNSNLILNLNSKSYTYCTHVFYREFSSISRIGSSKECSKGI